MCRCMLHSRVELYVWIRLIPDMGMMGDMCEDETGGSMCAVSCLVSEMGIVE